VNKGKALRPTTKLMSVLYDISVRNIYKVFQVDFLCFLQDCSCCAGHLETATVSRPESLTEFSLRLAVRGTRDVQLLSMAALSCHVGLSSDHTEFVIAVTELEL
jgi:hypothetical protein